VVDFCAAPWPNFAPALTGAGGAANITGTNTASAFFTTARLPESPACRRHRNTRLTATPCRRATIDTGAVSLSATISRRSSAVHRRLVSATTSKLFMAMSRHMTGIDFADAPIFTET
jgi:hypothetical protein